MKEIAASLVTETIRDMCIQANVILPEDVAASISVCHAQEPWPTAKETLEELLENMEIARQEDLPLCQDTGAASVFLELGQDVHITGGNLYEAIHEGVRQGYDAGYLRKSIVADPLRRKNTGDNTPAMIHVDIVSGENLTITLAPKGAGSENMSRLGLLTPSAGRGGVVDFVLETVRLAGPNPCPPIVVGIGIGGNFDLVATLAKKALLRPLDQPNSDPYYQELEAELLEQINALGIGPQGFGGRSTALEVNIETYPTHIAALPVAVNINCHVARRMTVTL
ncbi:MAG: fumarate hydratase [Oscillospiraceae bacterium]|nr:fumarate hydratase [Oscillospiraceae bacterium]